MGKWKDVLTTKPSQELKVKVQNSVDDVLASYAKIDQPIPRRTWLSSLNVHSIWTPALAACGVVIAFLIFRNRSLESKDPTVGIEKGSGALDLARNFELLKDLPVIENVELMLKVGEPEEWPVKKS